MTPMMQSLEVPKLALTVLNNLFEIESKLALHGDSANVGRNAERIRDAFEREGHLFYENPMGQPFNETRTDLDASISGTGTDDLVVVEVIKPVIRAGSKEFSKVVQRGIVVVEAREGKKGTV
jgi:hypothetical protein